MPLRNFSLLFIEDDKDTQEQIKMILEDDVREFYQAFDGKEGVAIFKEKNPDIILTDINMPYYSGLEVATIIKKENKSKPVIIMSAFDDRENLLNSINLGGNGFITKPVDIDLLYKQLNTIATELIEKQKKDREANTKVETLYKLAHYDTLTQIPNRLLFEMELTKSIKESKRVTDSLAIFFIDLDNFKTINDTFGHNAGDFALQTTVKRVCMVRGDNDILARRSGDEFLLLVKTNPDSTALKELANSILEITAQPIEWENSSFQLSTSIGVSIYPHNATESEKLIMLADQAMYKAKNSGKSSFIFADETIISSVKKCKEWDIVTINKNLYWDKNDYRLMHNKNAIELSRNEILLLSLLFSSINNYFTYEKIYSHIWGESYIDKKESLKTLIKVLRRKLPINFIKNIFNVGYKIELSR